MTRDFTDELKEQLLKLVEEVEDEEWCSFTDWLGDRWSDLTAWLGCMDVADYVDDMGNYHKKVIDKNNTTGEDIKNIFDAVYTVDDNYLPKFCALSSSLNTYKSAIDKLADIISPSKNNFSVDKIDKAKASIDNTIKSKKVLDKAAGDGATQEDINSLDNDESKIILNQMILEYLKHSDISGEEKVTIPLGPGLNMYYKVSASAGNPDGVAFNHTIEDQKVKLEKISAEIPLTDISSLSFNSDKEISLTINGENCSGEISKDGASISFENGDDTYNFSANVDLNKVTAETSVTTNLGDNGSVTSAIGIEASNNNWVSVPEPVPVTSPYTSQVPEVELPDINWEAVGTTVVVVAGVAVAVALVPETGGASLALLAI